MRVGCSFRTQDNVRSSVMLAVQNLNLTVWLPLRPLSPNINRELAGVLSTLYLSGSELMHMPKTLFEPEMI